MAQFAELISPIFYHTQRLIHNPRHVFLDRGGGGADKPCPAVADRQGVAFSGENDWPVQSGCASHQPNHVGLEFRKITDQREFASPDRRLGRHRLRIPRTSVAVLGT